MNITNAFAYTCALGIGELARNQSSSVPLEVESAPYVLASTRGNGGIVRSTVKDKVRVGDLWPLTAFVKPHPGPGGSVRENDAPALLVDT